MKIEWKSCIKVGVSVFVVFLAIHYWETVSAFIDGMWVAAAPLIIGALIAYPINILMSGFEKLFFRRAKRKFVVVLGRVVSMILAIVTMFAIVFLLTYLIIPEFIECITVMLEAIPGAIDKFLAYANEHHILSDSLYKTLEEIDWKSQIGQILDVLSTGVGNVVNVAIKTITTIFSGIVTGLIALIFSVYILLCKERISSQFSRLLDRFVPKRPNEIVRYTLSNLHDSFKRYIVGQCVEAVILGVLCTIGMLIFRFPYATMIGALVGFTALIPIAGAYIGAAVGAFMILTVSPIQALFFIIYIIVLQQIEGNLIYPRVVGSSLGLPGIWVLAAVTIGGGVAGVGGMMIGVPLASAVYKILRDIVNENGPLANLGVKKVKES